jgi:hypothetical protein
MCFGQIGIVMSIGEKQKRDTLTFDLKSARYYDADGRLHVTLSNISKANVCPYYGHEIPGFEELGLVADKVYQLYRDPEELAKGAPTSNGIQLMSIHIAVSADEPQKEVVAGTTGTDAVFEAPYLKNSLVIWDAEDIKNIEDNSVRELSCGYRYKPDMTPGSVDGVAYDGVMRDIIFNHVALVKEGRAGGDVLVADSSIFSKEQVMSKSKLSPTATLVQGALMACLQPKLAKDQKIDLKPLVQEINKANWATKKPGLIDGLKAAGKGKLAKDAEMADVVKMIDALNGEDMPDDDLGKDDDTTEADTTMDADAMLEKIIGAIKSCFAAKEGAADEPPKTEGAANNDPKNGKDKDKVPAKDEEEKVDKKAMDAAIAAAVKANETATIARMNAIAQAHEDVKPYVGKLNGAFDSAEGVYKAALDIKKIDVKDVPASAGAYRAILLAQPKPDDGSKKTVVQDSAMSSDAANLIGKIFAKA